MLTIIFLMTLILIQTNSIPVHENEDVSVTPKARYNFNHPPTVEEYDPILETIKYNEESNKPRVYREVRETGDESDTYENTSSQTIEEKNDDGDVQEVDKELEKGNIAEIEENAANVTQIDTATSTNSVIPKGRRKSLVRKTKVQKRILPETIKSYNSIPEKITIPKLSTFQTTTFKPTITTQRIIYNPKPSAEINQKGSRQRDPVVPIVEFENVVYTQNGNFRYSYVGGDGTKASEEGILKVFDDKTTGEAVVGSFSYTDKNGNDFSLTYTADENGYRPVGEHLPTPPPIPPAIARALQYLATKTSTETTTAKI